MIKRPKIVTVRLTVTEHKKMLKTFSNLHIQTESISGCLRILLERDYERSILFDKRLKEAVRNQESKKFYNPNRRPG